MRALLNGIGLLATGRARGFALIPDGFRYLAFGLAVLLGTYVVPALLRPWPQGGAAVAFAHAVLGFAATVLLPLAITFVLAGPWARRAAWRRFAVAFVWVWVFISLILIMLPELLGALVGFGRQATGAGNPPFSLALAMLHFIGLCYVIWLNWYLVRHGLGVSAIQAGIAVVLLVLAMSCADYARITLAGPNLIVTTFQN